MNLIELLSVDGNTKLFSAPIPLGLYSELVLPFARVFIETGASLFSFLSLIGVGIFKRRYM